MIVPCFKLGRTVAAAFFWNHGRRPHRRRPKKNRPRVKGQSTAGISGTMLGFEVSDLTIAAYYNSTTYTFSTLKSREMSNEKTKPILLARLPSPTGNHRLNDLREERDLAPEAREEGERYLQATGRGGRQESEFYAWKQAPRLCHFCAVRATFAGRAPRKPNEYAVCSRRSPAV